MSRLRLCRWLIDLMGSVMLLAVHEVSYHCRAVQVGNLRGFLGIMRMDKVLHG